MLPQKNRLTKKKDFDVVFTKGKSIKSGALIAKSLQTGLSDSRFGFVVSKKVSPKATVRNKVKRRLRKAVEDVLKTLTMAPADVVIITLPAAAKQEFVQLKEHIISIFNKL